MIKPRRILYVSGTRADFGLMESALHAIAKSPKLELGIAVTGMHLDVQFGDTIAEIEGTGLPIVGRVPVDHSESSGHQLARNIGVMVGGLADIFAHVSPDCVLILGDRGEMLAAAIAATHMSIPVAHIHGGERSGTIDESVRHAISKLVHYHFTATEESRERLIRMGERPESIHVVGAPGLDGLEGLVLDRRRLMSEIGVCELAGKIAVMVYHPVLQEAKAASEQTKVVLDALVAAGVTVIALKPNSDVGSDRIRAVLDNYAESGAITLKTHLPRAHFVSLLRHADLLVGNSSSGIIEAATFGIPVVNIGSRQNLRQRNSNVIDVPAEAAAIAAGLKQALLMPRGPIENVYGDGRAGERIVALLQAIDLSSQIMAKANVY